MKNILGRFKHEYRNGAYCEVKVYAKATKNRHYSDLIELRIVPENSEPLAVYMHALEAVDIISDLSMAVGTLMSEEKPLLSKD